MKAYFCPLLLLASLVLLNAQGAPPQMIPNPLISFEGFQKNVEEAQKLRETNRLTEEQFLVMMKRPNVVLLDARSAAMFELRHIAGAVNLSLPDFNEAALAKIIPSEGTTVLIYCNNNFVNSPISMASKSISTALNLHTLTSLLGYGYKHVYELGPLLDVNTTHLPFQGSEVESKRTPPTRNR